jgi:hypothetical protein
VGISGGVAFLRFALVALVEFVEEELEIALGPEAAELGGWGERAESGVEGDLVDGVFGAATFLVFTVFLQVEAGDLEAVEQKAGAARIEVVGGDLLQDLSDGELDGAAVFGQREGEGGLAAAAGFGVFDRAAGGVVVVAEVFRAGGAAERGALAAAAVGEDVAALEAFGFGVWRG